MNRTGHVWAVGIDLVRISQVEQSVRRFGARYLERLYTPAELAYCLHDRGSMASHLAARFAAKEAARKALHVADEALSWRSIEVERTPSGACELVLHGAAKASALERGLERFALSLSHDGDYATAVVVASRG